MSAAYVGRLAPSPTGDLHLGIARTSLVAWLDARAADGKLLMRIEDIDRPRNVDGSAARILEDLRWLGLDWDGPATLQSERFSRYEAALQTLADLGRTFACTCSRREIAAAASAPHGRSPRYPGTCREGFVEKPGRTPAIRLLTRPEDQVNHTDRLLGDASQNVFETVGDFVLRRADGMWAYQLAVTVDDLLQGVNVVVRGADLLDSTPRQILLRRLLDPSAAPLKSLHVPLVLGASGQRLAKRDGAPPVRALREAGVSAAQVIGKLAHSLGLLDAPQPISAQALVERWNLQRLRKEPVPLEPSAFLPRSS